MKRLLSLLALALLVSCSESERQGNTGINFSYTIDTLQVDPGEHLIFISRYMSTSSVSKDQKWLYNLNVSTPEMEYIDLENLRFDRAVPLEKEGPEGIGTSVSDIHVSDQGEFFFIGYRSLVKADAQLENFQRYQLQADQFKGDSLGEAEGFDFGYTISQDGKKLLGTYSKQKFNGPTRGLAIVDLESMTLKTVPIPELESLVDFNISLFGGNGNPRMSTIERVWVKEFDGKIYLSNTARNEAFIYDPELDSLVHKQFEATLTANARKGLYTKSTNSDEEMNKAWEEKNKEVQFQELFYDPTYEKFWRVSTDLDRMIGDSAVIKKVLTLFDRDLNQLHEEQIKFNISGSLSYFKEGNLHTFINLEDELGFLLIKPTYE
ncbi:protein of unknown function [Algoriphagus faecimaris]|uniref:DUF4221 domain-containing protein n=1 Tax=Algoriphagus faecimaris TaxID=686796 RepID=A0A1G6NXI3_9BACT|nr:DUF4221 family protein [Algoriphagus faecimaris]SDC72458.1 protein of unknown function [Algoriphagus faecimaris]